jgi:hypothetical protein
MEFRSIHFLSKLMKKIAKYMPVNLFPITYHLHLVNFSFPVLSALLKHISRLHISKLLLSSLRRFQWIQLDGHD